MQESTQQQLSLPEDPAPRWADRVTGAVLGAAIGDALGHPTEFLGSFAAIRRRFGPRGVTGFRLYWSDERGRRFAPYTDDTQMAECVLRGLLDARAEGADLDGAMQLVGGRFVAWSQDPQGGHRAPGNACLEGCRALARGAPWSEAGGAEAGGCGSVMRAYPLGLLFADDLARAEEWAVAQSRLTHRHPMATSACAALAVGVATLLRGEPDDPIDPVADAMIAAARRHSRPTAEMMTAAAAEARDGTPPEVTLARLEGWRGDEAIAAALYVLLRHPDDPRAALLEAANTPGDSDSIATLVGALLGARRGLGALPARWVREVERSRALQALGELTARATTPGSPR